MKVYIVVYHDPYTHGECEMSCCGAQTTEVKGVASSKDKAKDLIQELLKRISYQEDAFEIIDEELDGRLHT